MSTYMLKCATVYSLLFDTKQFMTDFVIKFYIHGVLCQRSSELVEFRTQRKSKFLTYFVTKKYSLKPLTFDSWGVYFVPLPPTKRNPPF